MIRWSSNESQEIQDKLVEELFKLYFMEGANVGDHDVLAQVDPPGDVWEKALNNLKKNLESEQ